MLTPAPLLRNLTSARHPLVQLLLLLLLQLLQQLADALLQLADKIGLLSNARLPAGQKAVPLCEQLLQPLGIVLPSPQQLLQARDALHPLVAAGRGE